jgi:hypothetical protein
VQGELFKADGEVVSSGRTASLVAKYELAAHPKPFSRCQASHHKFSSGEAQGMERKLAEATQHENALCKKVCCPQEALLPS